MAAYLIVDIEVRDPARYAEYIAAVPSTIAKYGGKYLARGGRAERLEGSWEPKRVVLLEFDSFDRAKEWWSSEDYRGPRELRQSASIAKIVLVEGV